MKDVDKRTLIFGIVVLLVVIFLLVRSNASDPTPDKNPYQGCSTEDC